MKNKFYQKLTNLFTDTERRHEKPFIVLKGIKPSAALGVRYRAILNKMVRAMIADVMPKVYALYKSRQAEITDIVGDSIIDDIYHTINIKMGEWEHYFRLRANGMATDLVDEVNQNVDYQFGRSLMPLAQVSKPMETLFTIQMSRDTKRLLLAKESVIKENVNLITDITDKVHEQITQSVMAASSRGRDAAYLRQELIKIEGMTKTRVKLIARDQLAKVTSVLSTAKQANLGIKKSIWRHSSAGETPRKTHVAADGKVFDIAKGCKIEGEYIYPGQKINCRCYDEPILEF